MINFEKAHALIEAYLILFRCFRTIFSSFDLMTPFLNGILAFMEGL